MQSNQAIVFDIPVKKSVSPPKLAQRLAAEGQAADPPTLEQIDMKLAKAKELRDKEIQKKCGRPFTKERLVDLEKHAEEARTKI